MPILKPNAKLSTYAQLMASEVFPNTLSCAPMEPSLTKLISFVIGGLTLIVLKPKDSTVGTMKSLLNNKLTQFRLTHQMPSKGKTHFFQFLNERNKLQRRPYLSWNWSLNLRSNKKETSIANDFFFKSFDRLCNNDILPFFEKRIGATCLSLVFTKFHRNILQKRLAIPSQGIFFLSKSILFNVLKFYIDKVWILISLRDYVVSRWFKP